MMQRRTANLFSIAPGTPFLRQLGESWLDGALDVGPVDDPLARIDTVFYLPTRRAARAFAEILSDLQGGAALLPTIRALGDADERALQSELSSSIDTDNEPDPEKAPLPDDRLAPPLLPTMPALDRRLLLTRLIHAASDAMQANRTRTGDGDGLVFPASLAEGAHLAAALGDLIDQMETEEKDWHALSSLVPDDHAAYWQLTLTLLTIITEAWPAILAETGTVDPARRRRLVLDARSAQLAASGDMAPPIIVAGSTGSIPATARFMTAVAWAPRGAVVLPGLDLDLPDAVFGDLVRDDPDTASHPQHGLARLLQLMRAERAHCTLLGADPSRRSRYVNGALLPADATSAWQTERPDKEAAGRAFKHVNLIEAANEAEESLALALAMKESVTAGESVALVTPDRTLAHRVALELERFGLKADDSAGVPLAQTSPARLLMASCKAWNAGFAAVPLLALLKHPLAALGESRSATRADARLLERLVLRGTALPPGLAALRRTLEARLANRGEEHHEPALRAALGVQEAQRVNALIDALETAFAPLSALGQGTVGFHRFAEAAFETAEAVAASPDDVNNALYAGEGGEALAKLRISLREVRTRDLGASAPECAQLLETLLQEGVVRPRRTSDPRLHIWGPLEARLLAVDHILLAGLNETAWPSLPKASPFLSRAMMEGLGLALPERRIGLSAHDIEQALALPKVTLSRSKKSDGSPTVASRWLQRLRAFLPEETLEAMRSRGQAYVRLARQWDAPDRFQPCEKPRPTPAQVPARLSITEIESLIRDPYTVYARRVLHLEEAPALSEPPSAAERGTMLHALYEELAPILDGEPPEIWPQLFRDRADTLLRALDPFPDVQALWQRRLARIAPGLLAREAGWSQGLIRRAPERPGAMTLEVAGQPCTLSGRADRIDLYEDGTAALIDFKSGRKPSKKQIESGLAPQLPLAAAMLAHGAFADLPACAVRDARYVVTSGNQEPVKVHSIGSRDAIEQLAGDALDQLCGLWAAFHLGRPFEPLTRPVTTAYQGPFHHLARVKEWRIADEAGETADAEAER